MLKFKKYTKTIAIICTSISAYFANVLEVNAGTASQNFQVTASVAASCTITAGNLSFSTYTLADKDAQSSLTATCTNGTTYNIGLDAGTGTGATVAVRKMTSGANTLNYSLFQDASRANVWGNTVGTNTVTGTGTGGAQTINVYGRIPAGQPSPIGTYTDNVVATITF